MPDELDSTTLRAVLDGLPSGVCVVDNAGRVLFWNARAEQITGFPCQELTDRVFAGSLPWNDDGEGSRTGDSRPENGQELDIFLRHKEGYRVPVRLRSAPVRDGGGTIIATAQVFEERNLALGLGYHLNARGVQNHVDASTGISDASSTGAYLEACLRDFADDGMVFGVVVIVIDDLDRIRRTYGASAARRLLHMLAATVGKSLYEGDIVGHWAEDRFIAILLDCRQTMLERAAVMLKNVIQTAAMPWWGDWISASATLGATAVRAGDTVDTLLSRAEEAMDRGTFPETAETTEESRPGSEPLCSR